MNAIILREVLRETGLKICSSPLTKDILTLSLGVALGTAGVYAYRGCFDGSQALEAFALGSAICSSVRVGAHRLVKHLRHDYSESSHP